MRDLLSVSVDEWSSLREYRTNRALATTEIQDIEKQLQVKETHLPIREAEVQDVVKMLQVKERDLQIREAEIQKMLQAVTKERASTSLQEDNIQRLAAMKESEENLRLTEAALTQQVSIAWQPDGAARESDLFSLSSLSTVRNSPRIRTNVDLSPGRNAKLDQDLGYRGNESASSSLASTPRAGPSNYTNIGFSSSKSHARLKEDSEYYSNE